MEFKGTKEQTQWQKRLPPKGNNLLLIIPSGILEINGRVNCTLPFTVGAGGPVKKGSLVRMFVVES